MPPAIAIAGAAVVGAGAGIYSGSKAAKAQKKAAEAASAAASDSSAANLAENAREYDTTRADEAAYRNVGYGALDKLAGMYGVKVDGSGNPIPGTGSGAGYGDTSSFTASPGYQFRYNEGLKAIDRTSAARGVLNSGGADKARMRYADGLASSEFDAYNSRLMALAGVGQAATGATTAAGLSLTNADAASRTTAAGQIGAAQTAAGNATAAGYANTGSSINSGINNLAASYLYSKTPTGYGGAGYGGTLGGIY